MSQRDFIPKANNFLTNKKPRLKLKTLQSGYEPDLSTKNYPTMCVGYKQKTPRMWGLNFLLILMGESAILCQMTDRGYRRCRAE